MFGRILAHRTAQSRAHERHHLLTNSGRSPGPGAGINGGLVDTYRRIFESCPDALVLIDGEGRISMLNAQASSGWAGGGTGSSPPRS